MSCFEEQAGRTPDAIALVFEGQQLSCTVSSTRERIGWRII